MHLSGLILDFYDDPKAVRDIWPSLDEVPEAVKTAHRLTPEEHGRLPDDLFALILVDSGRQLRKYACVDAGNTELSCRLFEKYAHKLPEEAKKVAAENLLVACGWYGLEAPETLKKEALGLGTAANLAIMGPSIVKGTRDSIHQNMAGVRAHEGGGSVVPPALMKAAEMSGTYDAPMQPPANLKSEVDAKKNVAYNTSAAKTACMHPHVDVTGKTPGARSVEKTASRYAVGERYPLDSYLDVQRAAQYFDDNSRLMEPAVRHEFAGSLVKRASELGIEVSDEAKQQGAQTYAPAGVLKQAFDVRRLYIGEGPAAAMLDGLWESRAQVSPDVFCETLGHIDKIAMLDCRYGELIPDNYSSTYGIEKSAEDDMWIEGNDTATKHQIEDFGLTGYATLEGSYGAEFADEFRKDPWGIFKSLPLLQKKRLARMATDNSPTGKQSVNA